MVELVIGRLNHRGKSQGVTSDDTRMGKSETNWEGPVTEQPTCRG